MRIRNSQGRLNFWPAYVDLMIILAVVGLITAAQGNARITKIVKQRETADKVVEGIKDELKKMHIKVDEHGDGISLPESVLSFESGVASPKMDEHRNVVFLRICDAIKASLDGMPESKGILKIVIEGHTDSDPIGASLCRYYPTNWELSAARATNVLRRMREVFADSADDYRMVAIGYGDTKPIEKGVLTSERNRRIEIKILPDYERGEKPSLSNSSNE